LVEVGEDVAQAVEVKLSTHRSGLLGDGRGHGTVPRMRRFQAWLYDTSTDYGERNSKAYDGDRPAPAEGSLARRRQGDSLSRLGAEPASENADPARLSAP